MNFAAQLTVNITGGQTIGKTMRLSGMRRGAGAGTTTTTIMMTTLSEESVSTSIIRYAGYFSASQ